MRAGLRAVVASLLTIGLTIDPSVAAACSAVGSPRHTVASPFTDTEAFAARLGSEWRPVGSASARVAFLALAHVAVTQAAGFAQTASLHNPDLWWRVPVLVLGVTWLARRRMPFARYAAIVQASPILLLTGLALFGDFHALIPQAWAWVQGHLIFSALAILLPWSHSYRRGRDHPRSPTNMATELLFLGSAVQLMVVVGTAFWTRNPNIAALSASSMTLRWEAFAPAILAVISALRGALKRRRMKKTEYIRELSFYTAAGYVALGWVALRALEVCPSPLTPAVVVGLGNVLLSLFAEPPNYPSGPSITWKNLRAISDSLSVEDPPRVPEAPEKPAIPAQPPRWFGLFQFPHPLAPMSPAIEALLAIGPAFMTAFGLLVFDDHLVWLGTVSSRMLIGLWTGWGLSAVGSLVATRYRSRSTSWGQAFRAVTIYLTPATMFVATYVVGLGFALADLIPFVLILTVVIAGGFVMSTIYLNTALKDPDSRSPLQTLYTLALQWAAMAILPVVLTTAIKGAFTSGFVYGTAFAGIAAMFTIVGFLAGPAIRTQWNHRRSIGKDGESVHALKQTLADIERNFNAYERQATDTWRHMMDRGTSFAAIHDDLQRSGEVLSQNMLEYLTAYGKLRFQKERESNLERLIPYVIGTVLLILMAPHGIVTLRFLSIWTTVTGAWTAFLLWRPSFLPLHTAILKVAA